MSPEQSNATRNWMVAIFGVILGFSGLVFGLINGNATQQVDNVREYAEENRVEIKINAKGIAELQTFRSFTSAEMGHIKDGIEQLNKKLDRVLEGR